MDRFKFPNPEEMFARLKQNGVKCCTNITPILSFESPPDDPYPTILAAWDPNNYQSPEKKYEVSRLSNILRTDRCNLAFWSGTEDTSQEQRPRMHAIYILKKI